MLSTLDYNTILVAHCRYNQLQKAKEILEEHEDDIDVMHRDGKLFTVAITHELPEILALLLEFYQRTKLQGDPESVEYKLAKYQLKDVIEAALEYVPDGSFPEIRELVAPYLSASEDAQSDSDSQNLGEFEDLVSSSAEDITQAHGIVLDHDEEDLAELEGMMLREPTEEDAHSDADTVTASENLISLDIANIKLAGALSPVNEGEDCPESI